MVPETDSLDFTKVKNAKLDKNLQVKGCVSVHMGSFKSVDPDGLKPIVRKHFGPKTKRCITKLFQAIYSTGYIPKEWRKI